MYTFNKVRIFRIFSASQWNQSELSYYSIKLSNFSSNAENLRKFIIYPIKKAIWNTLEPFGAMD
jgi:hypothetical protein